MRKVIKRVAEGIVWVRPLNPLVRGVVKTLTPVLPDGWGNAIPAIGVFGLDYTPAKKLLLKSDGHDSIATALYWKGIKSYESETTRVFLRLLKEARTVLDVGANTGVYALLAAIDDPRRKVYAFEAVPAIYQRLQENIRLNHLENLHAFQCAASDFDGEITVHVTPGVVPSDSSTLEGFRPGTVPLRVDAVTLDTFVEHHAIHRVDLMKIDTEATEHLVLTGARNLLRRDEPVIICEVLCGRTEGHLQELFEGTSYRFFLLTDEGPVKKAHIEGDSTYQYLNYAFIPESKIRLVTESLNLRAA